MLNSANEGQAFDSKAYMTALFNKLADKKDVDTAAKFMQQVPTLIGTAAFRPALEELDIKTDELRPLIKLFKNEEKGITNVVKYFNPLRNPEVKKELVEQKGYESFEIEERNSDDIIKDPFDALPYSAMSTTFQEFVGLNPNDVEDIEKLDNSRKVIYNTINSIKDQVTASSPLKALQYDGRTLKLKAVRLSDMDVVELDKTTKRLAGRAEYLKKTGKAKEEVTTPDKIFVMMITGTDGNPIYFSEEGKISTKDEGGRLVYQFLRDVRKEGNRYKVTDIYGKSNSILDPTSIALKIAEKSNIPKEQLPELIEEIEKKQQQEFKELYNFRQSLIAGTESPLINITGVSNGIAEQIPSMLGLNNISDFLSNSDDLIRTIDTVKSPRSGFGQGESVITIDGKEFKIDRPNLTSDIARKIAAVLTNQELSKEARYKFAMQFLSAKASGKTRKHSLSYLPNTDELLFSYSPTTYAELYAPSFTPVNLDSAGAQDEIYNALMKASGKDGKYFPAKMTYRKELLKQNGYQDYNLQTNTLDEDYSSYFNLLKTLPNTTIFGEIKTNTRAFNSYIKFALPNQVTEQIDRAQESFEQPIQDDFFDTLVDPVEISAAEKILNDAVDVALSDQWKQIVQNETGKTHTANYYIAAYINKDVKIFPEKYQDQATFEQVIDLFRDVYKASDTQINKIRESYNTVKTELPKAKVETTKSVEEIENEINEGINPKGTSNPSEDGAGDVFFYRKGSLPSGVTQEQIDDAQRWWNNSPLNKYIKLKPVANIVNSDAYARFVKYGSVLNGNLAAIELANKGSMVDVYHEAWHGFSQLFLSPEEKTALYKEVRKKLGGNKSFFEIEEILAEDFRTYAKNPKAEKGAPKRNSLFRRILNFLREIFGLGSVTDVMEIDSVRNMFDKLYLGKDLNTYSPLIDNVQWDVLERNTGVTSPETKSQVLSRQDSNLLKDSMDSIISEIVDEQNALSEDKAKTLSILLDYRNRNALYNLINTKLSDKLNQYTELYENTEDTEENALKRDILANRIRILKDGLDNFGDNTKGLVKYHIDNSAFDLVRQKYTALELDEEGNLFDPSSAENTERFGDKKIGDKSLLELAGKETLYILKSLYRIGVNGKPEMNDLGFKKLVDFRKIWNNTVRSISGLQDPQEMYNKLVADSKDVKEFIQLTKDKIPNPSTSVNQYEFKTTTSFWQDFNKPRIPYVQLTIFGEQIIKDYDEAGNPIYDTTDEGVKLYNFNVEVTDASVESRNIVQGFTSKFRGTVTSPYVNRVGRENKPSLNLEKIINDFADSTGKLKVSDSYNFARAIGIYLDDVPSLKEELTKNNKALEKYGLPFIFDIIKNIHRRDQNKQSNTVRNAINKFKEDPINSLMDGIQAGVLGKEKVDQKKQILLLAELQARFGYDSSNFAVKNAEKNLVFEHIENNSISRVVYGLNAATKLSDLWTTDKLQYMSHMDPRVNPYTNKLATIKSLFDFRDSNLVKLADKNLKLFMNSGTQNSIEEDGTNTTSLDVNSKMIQEIHTMLKDGMQEFMRHASKSSSFGAKIEGGINGGVGKEGTDKNLWVDIDMFAKRSAFPYAFKNHFAPYMAAEAERIFKFRSKPDVFSKYGGYNRPLGNGLMAGEVFTAFDNVLRENTKNDIYKLIDSAIAENRTFDLIEELKKDTKLSNQVKSDTEQYFNEQNKNNLAAFQESKFLDSKLKDKLADYNMSPEQVEKTLIDAYTMNSWIHNFEMGILFYGDFAQYNHDKEEMHKRNTGSSSGGRTLRTDIAARNFVNGFLSDSSYARAKGLQTLEYDGTFNTAIMQDVKRDSIYLPQIEKGLRADYTKRYTDAGVKNAADLIEYRIAKEIKKYQEMEEADAQGYVTFDAYRVLKNLENDWSNAQEILFQRIKSGEEVPATEITELLPPYKVQNFGFLKGTELPVTSMHKLSLAPLIPSVIAGSDLESLHVQMINKNIQYATFQTGSKVGGMTSTVNEKGEAVADEIYDNKEQRSLKKDIKFTPNTIYLEYLKNVTNVPSAYKGKTVFSTQLRKLILSDLYDNGELINPAYKDKIEAYEQTVDDYSDILKTELLNDIGYEYNEKTGKYTGNIKDFLDVVQRELERRDMPEHLVELVGLNKDNSIRTDLSLHLKADEIEKILVALVEKRLVKQRVKGESLVQVSSAMTNGIWDRGLKKATVEEIQKYMGSNNLPFYNRPDPTKPTLAMKVAIALQGEFINLLKLKDLDGKLIETRQRLNELIKDDKWLDEGNNRKAVTLSAVRIPVQGINSMEFMEVYEFLDPAAGNIIIPPSEIVAKSGTDFDIDKLTTFMPSIDKRGQYIATGMTNKELKQFIENRKNQPDAKALNSGLIKTQKAALENRLIETIVGILSLPDNYANLVRPNDTYLLKDDIADKIQDDVIEYDRFANAHEEGYRLGKKDNKVISPTRILESQYNLHKHEVNMIGKKVLGMIAIDNSLHPIFNSVGASLPATYQSAYYSDALGKYVEDNKNTYEMRLFLPHNETKDGRISLSGINSVDGKDKIADLYNQMMNGAVDVEKDAWIFFIQGNYETTPMITFLLKAGVPKEDAIMFVSNPLVREYAKKQRLISSDYAKLSGTVPQDFKDSYTKFKAAVDVLTKYGVKRAGSLISNANYYKSVTENVLNTGMLEDGVFDLTKMKSIIKDANVNTDYAVGMFLHYLELEKMMRGFSTLKFQSNPDTKTSKTLQELIRRNLAFEETKGLSKLEQGLAEKMQESILGSFFDNRLVYDLIVPLFPLRNNDTVTNYIINTATTKQSSIYKAFGKGQDGMRQFITQYKNAMPNYIFQNYMSNLLDEKGEVTSMPTEYKEKTISDKAGVKNGAVVEGKKLYVDKARLAKEYAEQLYTQENTTEESYDKLGLTAFPAAYNMFPNESTYFKYVFEREYQRSLYPIESLETNKDFKRLVEELKDKNKAYEKYLSDRALIHSFNRKAIMEIPTGSYTDKVLDMVEEFPQLKAKYPILSQLTKAKVKTKVQVLTLNDVKMMKDGQLAEIYHQNLKDLGDATVTKLTNTEDNKRLSKLFSLLPMMMIYQHGMGYSTYGFTEALPYEDYMGVMQTASEIFMKNNMNGVTFDRIFDRLVSNAYGSFKDYVTDPADYKQIARGKGSKATGVEEGEVLEASNPLVQALLARAQKIDDKEVGDTEEDTEEEATYNYNPSNVSEEIRNNNKKYVLDTFGTPTSIKFISEKNNNGYQFDFNDGTTILTTANGKALSIPNMNEKIVELSKKDAGYDIKTLIGLNKIVEENKSAEFQRIDTNIVNEAASITNSKNLTELSGKLLIAIQSSQSDTEEVKQFSANAWDAIYSVIMKMAKLDPNNYNYEEGVFLNDEDLSTLETAVKIYKFKNNIKDTYVTGITTNTNAPEGLPQIGRTSTNCQ